MKHFLRSLVLKLKRVLGAGWLDKVRKSNSAFLLSLRSAMGVPVLRAGRLSVIVPIYNVEPYLSECLQSIADQNYPDIEVILVDDGSTDSSREIARHFATRDKRFTLIEQNNQGLGAARNTGISIASGEFITFVDSDDKIPSDAYRTLLSSLQLTGSDFAVGGVERWNGATSWRSSVMARIHSKDILGITLSDLPEITSDIYAWNKVFRTEFFRRVVREFPTGILYEDQEPTARAYTGSTGFDVLARTTYYWRKRADNSSITQNKHTVRDLRDRISVANAVKIVYEQCGQSEALNLWYAKTVSIDFSHYYWLAPQATKNYWIILSEFLRELIERIPPPVFSSVEGRYRLIAYLIASQRFDLAEDVINALRDAGRSLPCRRVGSQLEIDIDALGVSQVALPPTVRSISQSDTPLITGITKISWDTAGLLSIEGYAYVENIDCNISLTLHIVGSNFQRTVELERFVFAKHDTRTPSSAFSSRSNSGIRAKVPVFELPLEDEEAVDFELSASCAHKTRNGPWAPSSDEEIPNIPPFASRNVVAQVEANRMQGLRLQFQRFGLRIESLRRVQSRAFQMVVSTESTDIQLNRIFVTNVATGQRLRVRGRPITSQSIAFSFQVPFTQWNLIDNDESTWTIEASGRPWGTRSRLPFTPVQDLAEAESIAHGLRPSSTPSGELILEDRRWSAHINDVAFSRGILTLSGSINSSEDTTPLITLMDLENQIVHPCAFRFQQGQGQFTAEFDVQDMDKNSQNGHDVLRFGINLLPFGTATTGEHVPYWPVEWHSPDINGLNLTFENDGLRITIDDSGYRRTMMTTVERVGSWVNR